MSAFAPRIPPIAKPNARVKALEDSSLLQRIVLIVALVGMPVTFFGGTIAGFGIAGWVWIIELAVFMPVLAITGVVRAAGRFILPYVIFIEIALVSLLWTPTIAQGVQTALQFAVPAVAYLLAWRLPLDVRDICKKGCRLALGLALVLLAGVIVGVVPGSLISVRPMAITLVLLFILLSGATDNRREILLVGLTVSILEVTTGSRTAAIVAVAVLATSGRLRLSARSRGTLLVSLLIAVVAVTQTQGFRSRVFYDQHTTVQAFLSGKAPEQLNTSGRLQYWPLIYDTCRTETIRGEGIGSSYGISQTDSDGALTQPHQELLRTFCDTGLPGVVVLWGGFVGWAVVRTVRRSRRDPTFVWHGPALQGLLAFIALAMTDNPLVYTGHFMAPLFILLALSDRHDPPPQAGFRGPHRMLTA